MHFKYNHIGVCTNPNIFFEHLIDRSSRTTIKTANDPTTGKWHAAHDCCHGWTGSSGPVMRGLVRDPGYDTEAQAAGHIIKQVLERYEYSGKDNRVNSPQAIVALQRRYDELTGKLGVQGDLFAMAA